MKAAAFDYHAPASIDEALRILAAHGDEARILAGGQSLVPAMTARLARPAHLVDINRIAHAELPTVVAGRLRIPPLMRHIDFEVGAADGPLGALLAELSGHMASLPVRLRGTFCGSLAHADPASAFVLAAVVLGADMVARSTRRGVRNMAAGAFFTGILATGLADDEMLTEVQIPLLSRWTRWGFGAVGLRAAGWPLATALVVYERAEDDMTGVRVGVGGVEATAHRLPAVERMLERRAPSRRLFREAADAAGAMVDPAGDHVGTAQWRRDLVSAVVGRALEASTAVPVGQDPERP